VIIHSKSGGQIHYATTPISKPEDVIEFEALEDLIIAMSACPQDITPVNGDDREIYDLYFRVR